MAVPVLSVGLPVYNAERYLAGTIACLLSQTFRDFELILCDNASTDGTGGICRAFAESDPRVRYVRNETNLGAAPNFNRAFALARGRYFKFAAYDDLYHPEYLRTCVEALDADSGAVLAHSRTLDIDADGKVIGPRDDSRHSALPDPVQRFRYLVCINHSCFQVFGVIRREALAKTPVIGGYVGSDRALLAELSLMGRFLEVPEPYFLHREHPERSTRSIPDLRRRTGWFDTSKASVLALPAIRMLAEYGRAIGRSELRGSQKARCRLQLLRWFKWNWRDVADDAAYWLRAQFSTPFRSKASR